MYRPYEQYSNYYTQNYSNGIHPLAHQPPSSIPHPNTPYQSTQFHTPYAYFSKPQQPANWPDYMHATYPANFHSSPVAGEDSDISKQIPNTGGQQLDLDKVLSTVGQLANTYHQVSPIVKQFGSMMKLFR
ncbi:YppG family protein [Oceanobacillus kapialis]|uniref:YppG family protein n=1 Tax=Oceanobacillus kapialis TaxID=481353 RepID=A0ABW5PV36_9BACI